MTRNTRWDDAQEQRLVAMVDEGLGDDVIGRRLGRTRQAVARRREKLGLCNKRSVVLVEAPKIVRSRAWTESEIKFLRGAVGMGWTDDQIGVELKRTKQSIKCKRENLAHTRGLREEVIREVPGKPWPYATEAERRRGEALLDRALGGVPAKPSGAHHPVAYTTSRANAYPSQSGLVA